MAAFSEGGVALGRRQRPVDTAAMGKEYNVMGLTVVFSVTQKWPVIAKEAQDTP